MPAKWMIAETDLDGDESRCSGCRRAMARDYKITEKKRSRSRRWGL